MYYAVTLPDYYTYRFGITVQGFVVDFWKMQLIGVSNCEHTIVDNCTGIVTQVDTFGFESYKLKPFNAKGLFGTNIEAFRRYHCHDLDSDHYMQSIHKTGNFIYYRGEGPWKAGYIYPHIAKVLGEENFIGKRRMYFVRNIVTGEIKYGKICFLGEKILFSDKKDDSIIDLITGETCTNFTIERSQIGHHAYKIIETKHSYVISRKQFDKILLISKETNAWITLQAKQLAKLNFIIKKKTVKNKYLDNLGLLVARMHFVVSFSKCLNHDIICEILYKFLEL
jgi:hypothetical protein